MRLIDADALLEASCYEFWQDGSAITPIGEYILGKFRQLIRNMPTVTPEPQWIPCSERLSDKEVLCCDTRGEMIIGYPYQDEESNTGYSAVLDDVVMIDCTAWMPLPEPYRAERKDGSCHEPST